MSRIGLKPINIPDNATLSIDEGVVSVAGTLGKLTQEIPNGIQIKVEEKVVSLSRDNDQKPVKSSHGMMRATIANMIEGVSKGWEKKLELIGTGYRARMEGNALHLSIGYSHPVLITPPDGVSFVVEGQNIVVVKGYDKQQVGLIASKIRAVRSPEPYKEKGIRYVNEVVRRKAGKDAKA